MIDFKKRLENYTQKKEGGFFDLPKDKTCKDRNHKPPTHICIPQGKGYRHICPSCGNITDLVPPQITC
jgi:hypothetical protein